MPNILCFSAFFMPMQTKYLWIFDSLLNKTSYLKTSPCDGHFTWNMSELQHPSEVSQTNHLVLMAEDCKHSFFNRRPSTHNWNPTFIKIHSICLLSQHPDFVVMGNPSLLMAKGSRSIISPLVPFDSSVYSSLIKIKELHDYRQMTAVNYLSLIYSTHQINGSSIKDLCVSGSILNVIAIYFVFQCISSLNTPCRKQKKEKLELFLPVLVYRMYKMIVFILVTLLSSLIMVHDQSQTQLHVGFIHYTMMSTMSIMVKKKLIRI